MRLAFVTPYLPCPADSGGRIRMYRLARALAARHELHLFSCGGPREARRLRGRAEWEPYASYRVRNSDTGAVLPLVTSRRVRKSCPLLLALELYAAHRRRPFDAVVVEHCYAAATARFLPGIPLVLDEHNVESRYARSVADASDSSARREVSLLERWERALWSRAALVTCVSEEDAAEVRAHRAGPVELVANGADLAGLPFRAPSQRAGSAVLFVGMLGHAPNVVAARRLAQRVMPLVWRERPEAKLVLCGRAPSPEVRALAGPRVEVTGTVESVRPYLDSAAVYVSALGHGAGTSLKVAEALAAGVPLVATSVSVRGYPLREEEHFLLAESDEALAAQALRILAEPARFDEMARRGREALAPYDWGVLGARFAELVEGVAR